MAVETDPNILDLLFDQNEGLLKEEVPEVQTIDFVSIWRQSVDVPFHVI